MKVEENFTISTPSNTWIFLVLFVKIITKIIVLDIIVQSLHLSL